MEVDEGRPIGGPTASGPEGDVCRYVTTCNDSMHGLSFHPHYLCVSFSCWCFTAYEGKGFREKGSFCSLSELTTPNPCCLPYNLGSTMSMFYRFSSLIVMICWRKAGCAVPVVRHCAPCRPVADNDAAQLAAAAPQNDDTVASVGIREVQNTADPALGKVHVCLTAPSSTFLKVLDELDLCKSHACGCHLHE